MVGYDGGMLLKLIDEIDEVKFSFIPQKAVMRATFYSVMTGSIDQRFLDRELFSFLFIYYLCSKRNDYRHSVSSLREIFEITAVHELNRSLYDQRSRKAMLMLPGIVPSFISDSIKKIGSDDFMGALCNFLIYYNIDVHSFLIPNDRMLKMIEDKDIFKQKFTDFGELSYGADNNWTE